MVLTARITILVSPEQKEQWTDAAWERKMSLGELIRSAMEKELEK